jgi:hypothetical protein
VSLAANPLKRTVSTERVRRTRQRRRRGMRHVALELYSADIAALVDLGWLASANCDQVALTEGFCGFVNQSLELGVMPPRRLT